VVVTCLLSPNCNNPGRKIIPVTQASARRADIISGQDRTLSKSWNYNHPFPFHCGIRLSQCWQRTMPTSYSYVDGGPTRTHMQFTECASPATAPIWSWSKPYVKRYSAGSCYRFRSCTHMLARF